MLQVHPFQNLNPETHLIPNPRKHATSRDIPNTLPYDLQIGVILDMTLQKLEWPVSLRFPRSKAEVEEDDTLHWEYYGLVIPRDRCLGDQLH